MALAVLGALPLLPAQEARAAETTLKARYGVAQSHFMHASDTNKNRQVAEAADAGLGWMRFHLAWPDLEPTRGSWSWAKADAAVAKAESAGIKVLGILGACPTWANGGLPFNYPPTDIAAWKNYVSTVCTRYRGRVAAWEVWNEENIHGFWMPQPDAAAFSALVKETTPAIRAADPDAKVVLGGVAGLDPTFLDNCLAAGVADYVDAIAYHPYPEALTFLNYTPQEANCRYIVNWLRWLISSRTSKPLEIWITEFGWTTTTVDEGTQASYLLRSLINYAGTSVDMVFSYNLWDESYSSYDPEANYGLLANDFSEKPACGYYRTFLDVFGNAVSKTTTAATFTCSEAGTLEAHSFNLADGGLAIAVWKSNDVNDTATVKVQNASYGDPVTVNPLTGAGQATPGVTRDATGKITISNLAVGKDPVIIRLNVPGMVPSVPAPPPASPSISSLSPAAAPVGAEVTINGSDFGTTAGTSAVKFGGVAAAGYTEYSDTRIKAKVPGGISGTVSLTVTRDSLVSNGASFAVQAESLTLVSLKPSSANQFTFSMTVEFTGSGFKPGATVSLKQGSNILKGSVVTVDSASRLRANFGFFLVATGSYTAVVRNPDGREVTRDKAFNVRSLWF